MGEFLLQAELDFLRCSALQKILAIYLNIRRMNHNGKYPKRSKS
jgi:hypothetical protein